LAVSGYASQVIPLFTDDFEDGGSSEWVFTSGIWTTPSGHLHGNSALGNAWGTRTWTGSGIAYEATVTLVSGQAAGLTFYSTLDGSSSYDLILDEYQGVFKIGKRSPYQVLGSYPVTVQFGRSYRIKVMASGGRIEAYLDGRRLLSVEDTTYASGRLGVIVFQAEATYDDLEAWEIP
jgi:hypothetical protein